MSSAAALWWCAYALAIANLVAFFGWRAVAAVWLASFVILGVWLVADVVLDKWKAR